MFHARAIQAEAAAPLAAAPARAEHAAYRPDIDGLRAIAVLSVVGFHAFPRFVRSGFVGVDIFFVISGFLISSIIFSGVNRGDFSFANFYARRVRRIFPALILVLAASLVFGWFDLFADEFRELGKQTAGGAGFVANYVFMRENSYFDVNIQLKPLVHLWSLGVEEQYYFVWPLIVVAAARWRLGAAIVILALGAASLGWSAWAVEHDAIGAFYAPQSRFWELLAGSGLAWVTLRRAAASPRSTLLADCLAAFGLFLIARAILFTDPHDFPGFGAAPAVVGAVLIIAAGPRAWVNRVVLSSRGMVWFGLISYPLYLWHWPLLAFDTIVTGATPTTAARVAAVSAAVVLAWATMRFVERPLRFSRERATTPALVGAMALVGLAGYGVFLSGGAEGWGFRGGDRSAYAAYFDNALPDWRYFTREDIVDKFRLDCDFADPSWRVGAASDAPVAAIAPSCTTRDPSKDKVLFLWGDSHAQMLYSGLAHHLPPNWQITIVATSGCAPKPGVTEDSALHACQRSNVFARDAIRRVKPDVVMVAQRDGHTVEGMQALVDEAKSDGAASVLMLGPVPQWAGSLPKIMMRRLWDEKPERTFAGMDEGVREEERALAAFHPGGGAAYVDLFALFCNESGCLTRVGPDMTRDSVTFDYGHLTPAASDFLAKNLLAGLVTQAAR